MNADTPSGPTAGRRHAYQATDQNLASNVGKPRTQERESPLAAATNDDFTAGRLKTLKVGGAVRSERRAASGFLGGAPATSGAFQGAVLTLDNPKPIYDQARACVDFSAGYWRRVYGDKVRSKIQLRIQDAFENGRLQAIAVNPEGRAYAYRSVDPRRFVLTASFDL